MKVQHSHIRAKPAGEMKSVEVCYNKSRTRYRLVRLRSCLGTSGLTTLIEQVGWWDRGLVNGAPTCERHPYTIENREMKVVIAAATNS